MGLCLFYRQNPFVSTKKSGYHIIPSFIQVDDFSIRLVDDVVVELCKIDARRPFGRVSHSGADHRERCAAIPGQSCP